MNMSGKLPDGDANGLDSIARRMVDEDDTKYVALVVLDAPKLNTNRDTGDVIPTARIRRIEPLLAEDLGTARRLLERAFDQRTGKATLPFELETELEDAFQGVNEEEDTE